MPPTNKFHTRNCEHNVAKVSGVCRAGGVGGGGGLYQSHAVDFTAELYLRRVSNKYKKKQEIVSFTKSNIRRFANDMCTIV